MVQAGASGLGGEGILSGDFNCSTDPVTPSPEYHQRSGRMSPSKILPETHKLAPHRSCCRGGVVFPKQRQGGLSSHW